jgi:hypothetical protein
MSVSSNKLIYWISEVSYLIGFFESVVPDATDQLQKLQYLRDEMKIEYGKAIEENAGKIR